MPRFPRSFIKTSYFHVIVQGINKSFIFNNPTDIKHYIKVLYELNNDYHIEIIAYCIMNNHAHILLQTENICNLSQYMHRVNTKYAMYFNKKYNRIGYVFRDRYKSEGIYSEDHLYNCIKYIYDNPVKAGLCTKPEDYKYSNYNEKKYQLSINNSYNFLDVDKDNNDLCKKIIENFLLENKIDLLYLKNNPKYLRKLLIILKGNYGISLRMISKEIGMGREKLRNFYKY